MSDKALPEGSRAGSTVSVVARRFAPSSGVAVVLVALGMSAGLVSQSAFAAKGDLLQPRVTQGQGEQPLLLQADELIYDRENNRVIAKGNVEVYYKSYALRADALTYDQNANTLNAVGNVRIKEPDGALINADRITLTDDFRDGFIRSFRAVTNTEARIAASSAYRKDGNTTVFERGVFTPCKQCEDDPDAPPIWRVRAKKLIHKKDEGNIYMEDGVFEFFGVPLAWVPYFYYPDPTVKRRSGFLAPEYSHSGDLGFTVGAPYFFAISPSADMTFTPVATTEAGYMLKLDYRQRLEHGSFDIEATGVFDQDPDEDTNKFRGSIRTTGEFELGSWWKWGWNVTAESDDSYRRFYRLDSVYSTDRISELYLNGQHDRNYFSANFYHFGGLTIEDSEQADSIVYPSLDYNYIFNNPVVGGELSYDSNVLALSRDDGGDVARLINQVKWRRTIVDPFGQTLTPFLQARADLYKTSDFDDKVLGSGPEDGTTAFRGTATAGLEYRLPFVKHTENATHVVEPIGQIIARPDIEDQGDIPNEDARSQLFDDTLLFDTDKFSGYDRVETGTRANVGVQYSVSTASGWNARLVAGQSYQVAGDNPFSEDTGLESTESDYVAGAYLDFSNNLQLVSQVRIDEDDYTLNRHDLQIKGDYGPFSGSANYVNAKAQPALGFDDDREEVVGTAAIKLANHWTLFGDLRYDLESEDFIRNGVGLKYSDECFILSVSYVETNVEDGEIEPDQTILVRYNLLNLGQTEGRTDTIGALSSEAPNY
jgi:LPS-assembly protein